MAEPLDFSQGATRLNTAAPLDFSSNATLLSDEPGRLRTASSQYARGLGQVASGLPKSIALMGAPDSSVFKNLDRIDQGKFHIPQPVYASAPGVELPDPLEPLYQDYKTATPELRRQIRQTLEGQVESATQSSFYQAGDSIDTWFRDNFPVNPEFQDEFWTSKVPSGLGSATGFVLAAAATRGKSVAGSFAAPAVLGSAINRVDQFESALAEGADVGTALDAAEWGGVIGLSEAVPIGNFLNRLDKVSGGAVKRYLVRAVRQGTEEAVQESLAGIMNAAVAHNLYDPERGIWNAERAEEGAVGFTTGFLLETIATLAMPSRRRGSGGATETDEEFSSLEAIRTDAESRLNDLNGQDNLTDSEIIERDFLRQNLNRPEVIAEAYGIDIEPQGVRESAVDNTPPLTPDDLASPLPNDLIQQGKETLLDAEGVHAANEILAEVGFPPINSQIAISSSDGGSTNAVVIDAFEGGVKLRYEDGRQVSRPFEALRGRVSPSEVENAEEVRSDTRQSDGGRDERERREVQGRTDLQQPAQAEPGAGDRTRQADATSQAEEAAGAGRIAESPEDGVLGPPESTISGEIRANIEAMKDQAGWEQRGGQIIRDPQTGDVTGRTPWLPRADWWKGRPGGYNEEQTRRIIDRGLAGERLGAKQQEYFEYLQDVATDQARYADFMPTADEMRTAELEDSQQNADDVALVARATEIDEDAVERFATRFEEDDAGFLAAVRSFVEQNETAAESRQSRQPETQRQVAQTDLLGDDTRNAQALVDEQRRRDAARNTGQDSVETGDPSDLFSQATRQVDLDDTVRNDRSGRSEAGEEAGSSDQARSAPDEVVAGVPEQFDGPDGADSRVPDSVSDNSETANAEPALSQLRGERISDEWVRFSDESRSIGVARKDMPQIKAEHRGALANFLKGRGIEGTEETVPASSLKPTQAEFSEKKVQKAKDFEGGNRAILVSSDGHVLDGHHQWMADVEGGAETRIIRLDAPIQRLLKEVAEFPSVEGGPKGKQDVTPESSNKRTLTVFEGSNVLEKQTFGKLTISEEAEVQETGEVITITQSAQTEFRRAVKRHRVLEKLQRCINA